MCLFPYFCVTYDVHTFSLHIPIFQFIDNFFQILNQLMKIFVECHIFDYIHTFIICTYTYNLYMYICTYIHNIMQTYVCIYIYIHKHTYMYTYRYTDIQTSFSLGFGGIRATVWFCMKSLFI